MKRVVEYKLHMFEDGSVYHPKFIHNPGWWYNAENKTYIGLILPSDQRLYYVPDTLTELSKEQLIERAKYIHNNIIPWVDATGEVHLTETQIEQWIDSWWEEHVIGE